MSGRYFSFNDPNGPLNNEGKRSRSKKKFRNVSQNKKQKKPNGNEQQKQKKPNGNEQQKQKKPNGNEQQKKPNGNEQQKQKKPNGNEQQKQKKPNGNEQQNKKQKKPPKKQQKQKQWDDRVVEKVTGCRQNASGTIEYRCNVVDQSAGAIARYAVWLIGSEVPQALVKAYQDSLSAKRRVKEPPKMDKNAMFAMVLARAHELWAFDFDDMVTILKGEFDPQLVDERIELLPQTNKPIERVKQEPVMESEQKPNRKKRKVSAVSPPSHLDAAGLAAWLRPTAEEAALRSATFERLRERMGEDELVLVGSSAHGLVLPGGDVDVVVVAESSKSVQEVSKAVRGVGNKMVVVKRARVPIVKYVDSKTRIPVDISVSKNGILLNKLLKSVLPQFRKLEELVVLAKCFVAGLGHLSDPATGGIGSYSIFILSTALLQHRPELHDVALEVLFQRFLRFWGAEFNSRVLGVSLHDGGSFFPKAVRGGDFDTVLALEDPLDTSNNVARATRKWEAIQRKFCVAASSLEQKEKSVAELMSATKLRRE